MGENDKKYASGGHSKSDTHTAEITLENGKIKKVKNKDGDEVEGSTDGPEGEVVSVESIALMTVQSDDPNAECWIYFNGTWYQWC